MDLTPRLKTIADSIKTGRVVADIGSDHAYLPIYLVKTGKIKKAIATDINKGPVEISKKRIKDYGLEDSIDVRMGSGLSVIKPDEADIIVIAGMGGLLMRSILEDGIDVAKSANQIILQPMRDSRSLIKWLNENSFQILHGEIVKENHKFYEIVWTRYNEKFYNKYENIVNEVYYYKNTPVLIEYIDKKINEYFNIINHLQAIEGASNRKRLKECIDELESYKEAKKCLNLNVEQ